MTFPAKAISELVARNRQVVLDSWLDAQRAAHAQPDGSAIALATRFLDVVTQATAGGTDIGAAEWRPAREVLEEVSRSRAIEGSSPSQTATFVFSLKKPLFDMLRREFASDGQRLAEAIWEVSLLIDSLGLFTTECFQKTREEVIGRQQQELLELSTPVVKLWDGVLALPLIGTLDSHRTQIVMESLLEMIVATGCEIAIIDITGVPTVDTLVAQHLIKTISAARLMGADCIISGIRPQIAQTIVHLGLDLDVISKANMADAFALALRRIGRRVVPIAVQRD
jgi:rsbT co-antagonist protein RsbR